MRSILLLVLAVPLLGQMPPQSLRDVFALTADQVQKITALYADYATFRSAEIRRMSELNIDLANQFRQPAPDPVQVGADYAEAETIRRDLVAKEATYQAQVRATLTPAQLTQYQALLNSITLQPLLDEAGCAFLENTAGSFATFLLGNVSGSTTIPFPGNIVPVSAFSAVAVTVLLPYFPRPPGPDFCGSPTFPLALREYLNATDSQIAIIVLANADYRDIYRRRQQRIADVQTEIRDENAKAQPDPMALGVRYVEIQLLSNDLQYQATQLRQRARAALTGDQTARLKVLDDLAASGPALSVLQGCDLFVPPPGSQNTTQAGFIFSQSCRVS